MQLIKYIKDNFNSNIYISRLLKRLIGIIIDINLCILCTWFAYIIRLDKLILFKDFNLIPATISIFIAIPIFWFFGIYRAFFRYTSLSIIYTIASSICVYGVIYFIIIGFYGIQGVPRSIGVLQPILLLFAIIGSRLSITSILRRLYNFGDKTFHKKKVLIYGAGEAGRQLYNVLENSFEFKVIGFLDDNSELHKQILFGKKIFSSDLLGKLVKTKDVSLVFLALPSINRGKRNQIIKKLNQYKIIVKSLPSISQIVDGKITFSDIKDLNVDDLLNREQVKPDIKLLNKNINFKTVLVTGAGGSIGSELCRQIIRLKPNKLILLELNEFVLYKIYEELIKFPSNSQIIPILANVQNQTKLETIFETFKVDTIYHAAAYKHVPLVEENICEGVKNNVFGTLAVMKAAVIKKVLNCVLISSDKAVRPTNIMGASKRLAELCVQGINEINKEIDLNFSIVRFGNVLESSGSVIPKFKKQIKEGGPITLTHEDVTRYFMTVTEAAQLVIQAGSMGKNSEVFVLDMGKSIRIRDLVNNMVILSGLKVKDINHLDGDIEIKITGLRPGEKLYEELLIGDNPQKTYHPKIQKANDPSIPFDKLSIYLKKLEELIENNEVKKVKDLLEKIIKSYKSNTKIVDRIFIKQISDNKHLDNKSKEINLN
jgi:FlaA1/EpsC-like NDP-sugar epimerase